jgi:hypothetical protein
MKARTLILTIFLGHSFFLPSFLGAYTSAADDGLMEQPVPPIPPTPPGGYGAQPSGSYQVSPTVQAPTLGSPWAQQTMVDPTGQAPQGYHDQQSALTNSWAGSIQQSMGSSPSMLNYKYVEAFYKFTDPKESGMNGSHGLGVALVMDLPTIFFLKGTFAWNSGSGERSAKAAANADYDLSTITMGGGAYMAITPKLHFVAEAGLIYANFQADGVNKSYTDGGIYIRPSLRYLILEWLELQAGVTVASTDDYDSKILDIGGYFRVLPMFDLNLGADFGDQNRSFRAGGRLRW